jgi:hypothetical protein
MSLERAGLFLVLGISACAFHADLGAGSTPANVAANPPPPAAAAPAAPAPALAAGPAAPPLASPGARPRYLGCFIDSNDRDLPELHKAIGGLSLEVCAAQCRGINEQFFGVQEGVLCHCGRSYGRYGRVDDSECKTPCQGNDKQMCGGSWRNSVYQLP